MSWLAPTAADRDLVDQVEARSPALYRLALVLAPALRVEPLLLRNARLHFLPQSDAGLESELWFSPLVSARSARSVLLRPGAARVLTDRLEANGAPFPYAEVWRFVEEQTQGWRFEDRLEQALRQSARRGDASSLREGLRSALRRVAAAPGGTERRDLARWLKGALPALAGKDGGPDELALAAGFAAASLGDPGGTLGTHMRGSESLPSWLREMIPSGSSGQLGLRLWPGVLEMLPPEEAQHRVDLGAPSPAPLHIQCAQAANRQGRWETCWPGRRIALPAGCTELTLTTLSGVRYRLAAKPGQTPPQTEAEQPLAGRPVLVAHYPEDAGAAEQVLRLLASAGIAATLVPESAAPEQQGPEEALLLRLWTKSAYRRSAATKAGEAAPLGGLVVRMDDAPLLPGAEAQGIVDLSDWSGDPEDKSAHAFLTTLRDHFAGAPREPEPEPQDTTGRIFFSYRREDRAAVARIHDWLRSRLPDAELFRDIESISPGVSFREVIEEHIRRADVVLAMIGPRWLTAADADGRRRIDQPEDFPRVELSSALRAGIRVIPVLIEDAPMPAQSELPEELAELAHRQAISVGRETFSSDMERFTAVLARLLREQSGTPSEAAEPRPDQTALDPEIAGLLDEIDNPETPPKRRLGIGDRLAELGDPRPGVGLDADGLPDIDWVDVPAGEFLFGDEKRTERTEAFRIARYPVTIAQYQAFIDGGGYRDERWWQGLAQRIERPQEPRWPQPNRPRTDVSWFEAVAFCRWVSAVLRMEIRLPTETEWEKAARGTDGREYPWGDGYRPGFANINETFDNAGPNYLEQTTAVGAYPHGASPDGALDLAGNVWEWCLNTFQDQVSTETERAELRVVRGGSWDYDLGSARSASRDRFNPGYHSDFIGFRVLCSSPIVGH